MGTVGLNFGAINSGTGIDVAATVSQIIAAEQAVETPWKNQLTTLKAQDTAFSSIGTDLATLSSSLQALTGFSGVFAAKQGASSDTNVIALSSATSTAVAGSHSITVNSLAQTSSMYSGVIANVGDTLSGSLTIQIGSGTAQTITVGSTSNTLSSLAAAINGASIGVRASVIKDTTGSRLSLVSATSGAAGQITLSGSLTDATTGTSVSFQQGQQGQDASLNIDGLDITTASNTVSDVIPGVTFQILAATGSSQPVQVQIANDNSTITQAMSAFVTAYNAVVTDIKTQEGKDANGSAQPLYGDPTLALIQSQLSSGLLGGSASGAITSIGQLGLSIGQNGMLTLDSGQLQSVLNTNFSDVMGYFQNVNSFGQTLNKSLNGLSSTLTSGAIYLALQQNAAQETSLNKNISDQETRIAADKARLTDQLNTANQILQDLPNQINAVNQLYSAVTGYNQQNG
ncbi:flagellar filament capping protein FliD [Edaphobacter flagellatus]|uniref:flagellar filament capping protein FliD n=1 Tax=Edaphobacter flagellatus TaxID=1933044 RepID=UPI0021B2AA7D|nr:flagellar filament capping protein FliD [Edaphobacter flagellatus]